MSERQKGVSPKEQAWKDTSEALDSRCHRFSKQDRRRRRALKALRATGGRLTLDQIRLVNVIINGKEGP